MPLELNRFSVMLRLYSLRGKNQAVGRRNKLGRRSKAGCERCYASEGVRVGNGGACPFVLALLIAPYWLFPIGLSLLVVPFRCVVCRSGFLCGEAFPAPLLTALPMLCFF